MRKLFLSLLSALVFFSVNTAKAETITNGPWDGLDQWHGWNTPTGFPAFGQTFELDYEMELNSFSFISDWRYVPFRAYIATWEEANHPGMVFFASPVMTLGDSFSGFQEITINTGELELEGGRKYVAIVGSTSYEGSSWGPVLAADLSGTSYTKGEFVYLDFWDSQEGPITGPYTVTETDLIFSLNVTPIPEPETYAMMLSGLGMLGFVSRRKKKALRS